jgi:hypothetical protein
MSDHPDADTETQAASSHDDGRDPVASPEPEFGPSGYLPERAAKRARKIVLRAPLGLQWVVGSLVAGVMVLIAGVAFLQGRDRPPPEPWVEVVAIENLEVSRYDADLDALIVVGGGRVRVFAGAGHVDYCAASNRLETADGSGIWSLTGRGLDGTPSLDEHPTTVTAGILYIDPTTTRPAPPNTDDPADRGCS